MMGLYVILASIFLGVCTEAALTGAVWVCRRVHTAYRARRLGELDE